MKIKAKLMLATAAAAALLSCSGAAKKAAQTDAEAKEKDVSEVTLSQKQMDAVGIAVGTMERKMLGSVVKANGQLNLDPQSKAVVAPLAAGVVRKVMVQEGSRVGRGQVVAYIENTDIVETQKNYLAAYTEASAAYEELQRQRLLAKQGAGVKKTLQQANAAYRVARASMAGLRQQLQQLGVSPKAVARGRIATMMPVKSPIGGTVAQITASIGSYVDMQTPIMEIVDNSRLHCDLRVFEKDFSLLKNGQKVEMTLTNNRAISLEGRVKNINTAFDDATKAVKVHVSLPNKPDARLMPGMFVSGAIQVGEHLANAMPDEAIVSMEGKKYIFLLVSSGKGGYKFRPVEVVTGSSALGYTEVQPLEDLDDGAKLVTRNAFYISSMMEGGEEE